MAKVSHITYIDGNGSTIKLPLPTIQDLSVPDVDKIPEHATVTGQYRQQYTATKAPKPSFTIWLEDGTWGEESVNVKKVMDTFDYLKKNRIRFNLSTSHGGEEARFLGDLVIENVTYRRDASHRNRLVAVINCTKLKMVELEWSMVDVTNVFGYNVFTGTDPSKVGITEIAFKQVLAKDELKLNENIISTYFNKLGDAYLNNGQISVARQVGNYVEKNPEIPKTDQTVVFKLVDHIDMADGERQYHAVAQFESKFRADEPYTCTLLDIDINVDVKECYGLHDCVPVQMVVPYNLLEAGELGRSITDMQNGNAATWRYNVDLSHGEKYVYNFAETYPLFTPSRSFEYAPTIEELCEFFNKNSSLLTDTQSLMDSGYVYAKNGYIQAHDINEKYTYTIRLGDHKFVRKPTGALDISHIKLTNAKHDYKLDAGQYQDEWDEEMNNGYEIVLVLVTMGTMLQIYLISPSILMRGIRVVGNA